MSSDYYPWGGELQFSNNDSNHYKFTGKERDAETQLDYFGARYYANWTGRFLTTDPVVITPERLYDPQELNQYSYVRNNPLRFTDPTGKDLSVSGDANAAKQDLCAVAGDACNRVTVDKDTGSVSFNTDGLDLSKNEGAALINDLVNSTNHYDFSVGDTVETAQGTLRVDHIANLDNQESHAPLTDLATPKKGVADQVAIDRKVKTASDTKLQPAVGYTTTFHELAEAYGKVDHDKNYDGAHQEAKDREKNLRDQRPSLKEHNPGSGPGDRYQQRQPEQIIKK
jgi:RHS repeat-associated protein